MGHLKRPWLRRVNGVTEFLQNTCTNDPKKRCEYIILNNGKKTVSLSVCKLFLLNLQCVHNVLRM